jgi:beta-glucosidase
LRPEAARFRALLPAACAAIFVLLAPFTGSTAPAMADTANTPGNTSGIAHPELWPKGDNPGLIDPATESFISDLMAKMTPREKVGQMIQADTTGIKPEDLHDYPLGSVLAGGNSPPLDADDRAPVAAWIRTTEAFHQAALQYKSNHAPIPLLFGIDAVHGNSNLVGAVIFPHNIGLGAAHDPKLIEEIGRITALESAAAGIDWAFAPTVAVPRDDRWGRTYEGYSELPDITRDYAAAMVRGLQGAPGKSRIQAGNVAATVKHFMADGGTENGVDQGDAKISEAELIDIHAPGYISGIGAGAMTVMASFSSWHGVKMHGNKSLLTDVLKNRLGFAGFVIGDWNAHSQVPGCDGGSCAPAFNAGLDMAMAPHLWKALFENTLKQAEDGTIPMARIDDAVRRILRVKARLGLFDPARPLLGQDLLGTPEHRALARRAVAESLVLLKNNGGVLPVKPGAHVLVTGSHADDIGLQCGGWTYSWQGTGNTNADFPHGTSIYAGLKAAIEKTGGSATLSPDGSFQGRKPDLAIVVFGERPYAETAGDIASLAFQGDDRAPLDMLRKLKAQGIKTVALFLSGRPLWVNPELNASDAFVAGFLPGTEGAGIADVLVAKAGGAPNQDFRGRLSFSWPKRPDQFALNYGDPDYDPLFAYGYGLGYGDNGSVPELDEAPAGAATPRNVSVYYAPGKVMPPWNLAGDGAVAGKAVDSDKQQEAAQQYVFNGKGRISVTGPAIDLTPNAARLSLRLDYRMDAAPTGPVTVMMGDKGKPVDVSKVLSGAKVGQWISLRMPLECFRQAGADLAHVTAPFVLEADAPFALSIVGIQLEGSTPGACNPVLAAR